MDHWKRCLFIQRRDQDEHVAGCSCNWNHFIAGATFQESNECCISHGTDTGKPIPATVVTVTHKFDTVNQVTLAFPFLPANAKGYLARSFELTRQFLFKWTVNWRFVGEERFLSREFAITLIALHLAVLAIFVLTRWIRPSGLSIPALISIAIKPLPPRAQQMMSLNVTQSFILTSTLTSIAIGMLCARSLHYQFYAYVALSTPFLLWKAGLHPILIYAVWGAQEWGWNVYPSTDTSSKVVVGCLVIQVFSVWWGTRNDLTDVTSHADIAEDEKEHDD